MTDERPLQTRRSVPMTGSVDDPSSGIRPRKEPVDAEPPALRELAAWYRGFAERAGNPTIWEARLRTAEDLEAEADRIEQYCEAPAG